MNEMLVRAVPLIGPEAIERLRQTRVAVIGLGGVGGLALETLVRSGVGHVFIADHDQVEASNLNRQILFTTTDIGQRKVACAIRRMLDINPELDIRGHDSFIDETTIALLDEFNPDHIVDAIDSIKGKAALIAFAKTRQIPIVVCLGMGNRRDIQKVVKTTLEKTSGDPLAKALRTKLKANRVKIEDIPVIHSKELPSVNARPVASMMGVPATAGLLLATHVIDMIIKGD